MKTLIIAISLMCVANLAIAIKRTIGPNLISTIAVANLAIAIKRSDL